MFSRPGPFVEPNLKFKMLLKARACSLNERATMVLIEFRESVLFIGTQFSILYTVMYKILYRVKDSISRSRAVVKPRVS